MQVHALIIMDTAPHGARKHLLAPPFQRRGVGDGVAVSLLARRRRRHGAAVRVTAAPSVHGARDESE